MSPEELIQLMRITSIAKVRAELEALKAKEPETYLAISEFYQRAYRQS